MWIYDTGAQGVHVGCLDLHILWWFMYVAADRLN